MFASGSGEVRSGGLSTGDEFVGYPVAGGVGNRGKELTIRARPEQQSHPLRNLLGLTPVEKPLPLSERRRAVALILSVATPTAIVFSGVNYVGGHAFLTCVQLGVCLFLLLPVFLLLRSGHSVTVCEHLLAVAAVLIFSSLFIDGGIARTGIYWVYIYPFFIFYLMGQRRGWWWNLLFVAMLAMAGLPAAGRPGWLPYSHGELVYFAAAYAFCLMMAAVFGMLRTGYEHTLEERVAERTRELAASRQLAEESEARYRAIFEAVQDVYFRTDMAGCIMDVSPSCRDVLGYATSDILGQPVIAFCADAGARDHFVAKIMELGRVNDYELDLLHSSGRSVAASITAHIMTGPDGKPVGMEGMIRDISARKRAEERERQRLQELAHALRLNTMGEMASEIAHELNQPLTAIETYSAAATQLLESGRDSDRRKALKALEEVAGQADRAARMIRRLRRLACKGDVRRRSTVDMSELIQGIAALVEADMRLHHVRLDMEAEDGLLVLCDRVLLEQVVLNLMRNAIEAMRALPEEGRRLCIHAGVQSGMVRVSVADSGPGLPDGGRDRVFEAFYSTKPEGMGLGLSICRSIVEAHGGRIRAETSASGGTTFVFELPASGVGHEG